MAATPGSVGGRGVDSHLLGVETSGGLHGGAGSLVFSSVGRDGQHGALVDLLGGIDFPQAHWNADSPGTGSPTLSARKPTTSSPARTRDNAAGVSMLGSQASTSSVRSTPTRQQPPRSGGSARKHAHFLSGPGAELRSSDFDDDGDGLDEDDNQDIPSSSPYLRTPSMELYRRPSGPSTSGGGALSPGSPTPNRKAAAAKGSTSSTRLAPGPILKHSAAAAAKQGDHAADEISGASPSQQRFRQVSANTASMNAGDARNLGLGFNMEEINEYYDFVE